MTITAFHTFSQNRNDNDQDYFSLRIHSNILQREGTNIGCQPPGVGWSSFGIIIVLQMPGINSAGDEWQLQKVASHLCCVPFSPQTLPLPPQLPPRNFPTRAGNPAFTPHPILKAFGLGKISKYQKSHLITL